MGNGAVCSTRTNPVEPGQPEHPVKVTLKVTGEDTLAPFVGELNAIFVQPVGVGVGDGVGVGGGEALIRVVTLLAGTV
jgi:hypothetical protein